MLDLATLTAEGSLICPICAERVEYAGESWRCTQEQCAAARSPYPVIENRPVLVDFERSVLSLDALAASAAAPQIDRESGGMLRRVLGRVLQPANKAAPRLIADMVARLRSDQPDRRPRILVVGGGAIGAGLAGLYEQLEVDLVGFDIYASPFTQFIADGHRIPLAGGSVDGVVIQAVLEHVLEPGTVVAEIHRVLRPGGIVYADTPFLQQVHEGPYDFTRYTDSGHRYLFRDFGRIESGAVAGAGTQLAWSIGHFVRALTRSRSAGSLAQLCVAWLPRMDRFLDARHSLDSASSVFFYGRKSSARVTPEAIIAYYQGGQ